MVVGGGRALYPPPSCREDGITAGATSSLASADPYHTKCCECEVQPPAVLKRGGETRILTFLTDLPTAQGILLDLHISHRPQPPAT